MKYSISFFKNYYYIILILSILLMSSCRKAPFVNGDEDVSIMSFNIRFDNPDDGEHKWDNRKEACIKMLKEKKVSVFGIQEGLHNQVTYLDSNLPSYDYVGVGRDDGHSGGEYAAIFYLKDEYELIQSDNFWLSETPNVPSLGWDANNIRITTWAHFRSKATQQEFYVFNTHFDHIGAKSRKESAHLLVTKINEVVANNDTPVFITGDFNALLIDVIFQPILKTFYNSKTQAKNTDSVASSNAWGKWASNIDFVFYKNADIQMYDAVNEDFGVPYISDHYPVMAKFKM